METPILYKDLDLSLTAHPITLDITPKLNQEAVKRSIQQLIRWKPWTVPFNPKSDNFLSSSLFDNIDAVTALDIKDRLKWLIETYEPRCKVNSIRVLMNLTENGFDVEVNYSISSLSVEDTLKILLTEIR